MKKSKHPVPTLIFSLLLSAHIGLAQEVAPGSQPAQDDAPTQKRVRRVDAPSDIAPMPAKQGEVDPDNENAAGDSEILALREQISAVNNSEEKIALQFKLIDRLVQLEMKPQAISELVLMSQEDRFDPQSFYNIGNALARLDNTDGAVKAYRKAIGQRKGRYSRALNNLGVVLLRQGRWDDAFEALISALRLENFRYAEASYNLGRLYSARGETDLAIREWRRALAVDPEHNAAGQAILTARRTPEIAVVRRPAKTAAPPRIIASAPQPSPRESFKPEKVTPATRIAPRVLTVDPETYDILQRARTARDKGRNQEAVNHYNRVISRMDGYFPPANLELSFTLINLKRNDEAVASLLLLAERDGNQYPISHYHLARLYELRGESKLAEQHYVRAATLYREDNPAFLLDVSRVRERLGDFSGALKAMEEYVVLMERQGQKPDWSEQRLTQLRQQVSSNQVDTKN